MDDASNAQYGTPTPTATVGHGPPQPHSLPHTGYDVAYVLLVALVFFAVGTAIRTWRI